MATTEIPSSVSGSAGGSLPPKEKFKSMCSAQRTTLRKDAEWVLRLKNSKVFDSEETYDGQHGEMKANIMLAYRHLEDARMRIGKILQAAGDGISILDK